MENTLRLLTCSTIHEVPGIWKLFRVLPPYKPGIVESPAEVKALFKMQPGSRDAPTIPDLSLLLGYVLYSLLQVLIGGT